MHTVLDGSDYKSISGGTELDCNGQCILDGSDYKSDMTLHTRRCVCIICGRCVIYADQFHAHGVNRDRAEAPRTGLYCTSYTDTHHTPGPCSCVPTAPPADGLRLEWQSQLNPVTQPPASPNHVPDCFTISISTPRAVSWAFEPHTR